MLGVEEYRGDCLVAIEFSFGLMTMFLTMLWNSIAVVVVQQRECTEYANIVNIPLHWTVQNDQFYVTLISHKFF